jgi:NAD(P)H-hydrate repair Nnr-like enzyme with NAD(P)H-hydrate dehydratase domain
MNGYDAARLGAYFHGKAGDQLSSSIGKRGMIASDLPKAVASIIKKYE